MAITPQDKGLLVSLVLNGAVMLISFILFPILKRRYKDVYEPRCSEKGKNAPNPPPDGPINWIFSTLKFTEEQIYVTAGLDALMYLRFLKLIFRIILLQAIFAWIVLIPVNVTASNKNLPVGNTLRTEGLAVQSMSNIPEKSHRFWAHLIDVFYISILTLILVFREIRIYNTYRLRFKKEPGFIENYTSAITEVPRAINKENGLRLWFARNFPSWVLLDVQNTYHVPYLEKKYEDREELARKYEKSQQHLNEKSEREEIRARMCCGKKVDALDYYRNEIYNKEKKIELHKQILSDRVLNPISFVTFDSIQTQNICNNIVLDENVATMIPRECPEPKAIFWHNTHVSRTSFLIRSALSYVATFFLVLFWMIPVGFAMALTNLTYLSTVSWLSWLVSFFDAVGPVVRGFFEGYLPVIILAVFMSVILPLIARKLTERQGHYSKVSIEIGFFHKMYVFFLVNSFIGVIVAGSVFNLIQRAIEDPGLVIPLLASSVPLQAFFFTNYVMLYAFFSLPLFELLRIIDFVTYQVKTKLLTSSLREKKELRDFGPFSYGLKYALDLLVFLVVITYSTMYPFILIFGVMYCAFAFIAIKYNSCFVRKEDFRMGGQFFPNTITKVVYSLMFYQIVMFCVLLGFKFYYTAFIAIIFIATIIFRFTMGGLLRNVEKFSAFDQYRDRSIIAPREGEIAKNDMRIEDLNQRSFGEVQLDVGVIETNLPYKDAYKQPILKQPDEVFTIGEYGEFDYQSENIDRDYRNSEHQVK